MDEAIIDVQAESQLMQGDANVDLMKEVEGYTELGEDMEASGALSYGVGDLVREVKEMGLGTEGGRYGATKVSMR